MRVKPMSVEQWKEGIETFTKSVRYFEHDGKIRASWVGVNPNIEPLLGVYFTEDDREIKKGTGWFHA